MRIVHSTNHVPIDFATTRVFNHVPVEKEQNAFHWPIDLFVPAQQDSPVIHHLNARFPPRNFVSTMLTVHLVESARRVSVWTLAEPMTRAHMIKPVFEIDVRTRVPSKGCVASMQIANRLITRLFACVHQDSLGILWNTVLKYAKKDVIMTENVPSVKSVLTKTVLKVVELTIIVHPLSHATEVNVRTFAPNLQLVVPEQFATWTLIDPYALVSQDISEIQDLNVVSLHPNHQRNARSTLSANFAIFVNPISVSLVVVLISAALLTKPASTASAKIHAEYLEPVVETLSVLL